jgi:23S rRNA (adenine2503-C2)-methyltransferase
MSDTLIHSLSRSELDAACVALGQPRFRAGQIWSWLYQKDVAGWADMKNIPVALREQLSAQFDVTPLVAIRSDGSPDGTRKLLVRLRDAEHIEEVIIPAPGRNTVCLSSQVGCRFRCAFCASGQAGFTRNLEAGEMVGQVLLAARELGAHPNNVVFMGIGEPFDNYESVLKAVRIINDKEGIQIGARKITISTSGIVPGIERLAGEGVQVELSISLHAANDELRSTLMPVNRQYPLADLLRACRAYFEATGRLITFEYTLIRGMNDSQPQAEELVALMRTFPCRANLIPLSPVAEFRGETTTSHAAEAFLSVLRSAGLNATLRSSKGRGVNAACGQLRSRHEQGN